MEENNVIVISDDEENAEPKNVIVISDDEENAEPTTKRQRVLYPHVPSGDNHCRDDGNPQSFAQVFGYVPYEDNIIDYFPAQLVSHGGGSVTVKIVYSGTIYLTPSQVLMAKKFQLTLLRILLDQDLNKLKDILDQNECITNPVIHYLLLPSVDCDKKEPPLIDWDCLWSSFFRSPLVPWSGNAQGDIYKLHSCSPNGCVCCLHTKDGVVGISFLEKSLVFTPHNGKIYGITCILD